MSEATPSQDNALTWGGPGERYRLKNQITAWDQPDPLVPQRYGVAAGVNYDLAQPPPGTWHPRGRTWTLALQIALIALGTLGLIAMLAYVVISVGLADGVISLIAAIFPLLVVAGTFLLFNRWLSQRPLALIASFLWGAGISTSLALLLNQAGADFLTFASSSAAFGQGATPALVAPLVEEALKGGGVILILLWQRRYITSGLDGMVFAGILAAGFAFTENILYFVRAESMAHLTYIFILRAIASPFQHAIFTSMTGIAMAIGLTRMKGKWSWSWTVLIGLATAMLLHGLWNGFATLGNATFFISYGLLFLPLVITWLIMGITSAVAKRRLIIAGLRPYVQGKWIHPIEANMLCSLSARGRFRRWAFARGRDSHRAMKDFQRTATVVALRYVMARKRGVLDSDLGQVRALLERLEVDRQKFWVPHASGHTSHTDLTKITGTWQ